MKKMLLLILAMFVLTFSSTVTVSAAHYDHYNWSHHEYDNENWHHSDYSNDSLPFKWHEHQNRFGAKHYRMEQIHDRDWDHRFPGLRSYKWHDRNGEGFWYHGQRVTNAVLFYNDSDELVSVGFMNHGSFIFIRDDHRGYENYESFFSSWFDRNDHRGYENHDSFFFSWSHR